MRRLAGCYAGHPKILTNAQPFRAIFMTRTLHLRPTAMEMIHDAAIAVGKMHLEHRSVHFVHDPLALGRRDDRASDQAAHLAVHEPGESVHGLEHEPRRSGARSTA